MRYELSAQQKDIVSWAVNGRGSSILLARAGCGKTTTIMEMVYALANIGTGNIYIGAFNRAIADELTDKIKNANLDWRTVQAGTFHSLGYRAWRKVSPKVEIDDRKVYSILESKLTEEDFQVYGGFIAKAVSFAKQRAFGVLEAIDDDSAWYDLISHFGLDSDLPMVEDQDYLARAVDLCQKTYRLSLQMDREVIDYDDMILAPLVHKARLWQYQWMFIDEAQDTNPARRALAFASLRPGGRLVAVGDDKQAIYGFTGADSDSLDIIKDAKNCTTFPLNLTYRCPKNVVKVAQNWVHDITAAPSNEDGVYKIIKDKVLPEEKNKGEVDFLDLDFKSTDAILCRNTAPLIRNAFALLRRGVACKVEGRDIGEGLIKLAQRWKIKRLNTLEERLKTYLHKQTVKLKAKDRSDLIERITDQVETLQVLIEGTREEGGHTIDDLIARINRMFGDTRRENILTLSTIHKAKGREWDRVFWYGRNLFQPSSYAEKDWQIEQEDNLMYVAATRAKKELIEVLAEK